MTMPHSLLIAGAIVVSATLMIGHQVAMGEVSKPTAAGSYEFVRLSETGGFRLNTTTGEICVAALNTQPDKMKGAIWLACSYASLKGE
jgi:hypothetical protein